MANQDLTIHYQVIRKHGTVALSIENKGTPIKIFTIGNVLDEGQRNQAVESIVQDMPGLGSVEGKKDLGQELQKIAHDLIVKNHKLHKSMNQSGNDMKSKGSEDQLAAMPEDIRREAEAMLKNPLLIQQVIEDIAALGVAGETNLSAALYLIGTSRLCTHPLAGIIQGPSSSGKSFPLEQVTRLFPEECVLRATELSPMALYYMEEGSLVHKFVVAGERSRRTGPEAEEATKALRQMISERRIDKRVVAKTSQKMETVHLRQDGPIAYVETTTKSKIFDEDRNRAILLQTDDREEQTRRIVSRTAANWSGQAAKGNHHLDRIVERHHAVQRLLMTRIVVVPYAERLAAHFPQKRLEARRAFNHVMAMVAAATLLHQFQRETDEQGRLIAQQEDYAIAARLLDEPMSRSLGRRVSASVTRLCERILARFGKDTFTISELSRDPNEPLGETALREGVDDLVAAGFVEITEQHRGRLPTKYRAVDLPRQEVLRSSLPAAVDVFGNLGCGHGDESENLINQELMPAHP